MPSARNSVEEALDLGDDYVKSIGSDEAAIASAVIIPDGGNTGDDEEQDSESSLNYGIDSDEEDALSMNTIQAARSALRCTCKNYMHTGWICAHVIASLDLLEKIKRASHGGNPEA
ncbi:hypothetical protein PInf_026833 [Phytophthora infestans]|nr:hypothetical protein PInf_026833 [Phytophthora infestans]